MRSPVRRSLGAIAVVIALAVPPMAASTAQSAPAAPLSVGTEGTISKARPGNAQTEADVAWNGSTFFVVWQEHPVAGGPAQVWGARVTPDGSVLDPDGILLASDETDSMNRPKVAGGRNRFMVVWEDAPPDDYSDIGAAMVSGDGQILRQWTVSAGDNSQTSPDVAWNGRMFLAVWQDQPDMESEDIYGARVLPDGFTLDGCSTDACHNVNIVAIPIATGATDELAPVVGAPTNGTRSSPPFFEVAWTDDGLPSDPGPTAAGVRHNAVDVNGWRLDREGVSITEAPGTQTHPAIAYNGAIALFAWTDTRPGAASDIRATTMQPGDSANWTGTPAQPDGVLVSGARNSQSDPDVTRRSGHFVAVWTDMRSGGADVYASRVGPAGAVLDPAGVAVAAGSRQQRLPAVASSGSKVIVAYQRDTPAAPFNGADRVYLRIVS